MIKSTKKSLRALMMCALLLVGGFIVVKAMNNTEKVKKVEETVLSTTWYFTGGEHDDPTDPSNYTDDPNQAPTCDNETEVICQIAAPKNGTLPDMDYLIPAKPGETVTTQILEAQDELAEPNGQPRPNDTVKKFRSK